MAKAKTQTPGKSSANPGGTKQPANTDPESEGVANDEDEDEDDGDEDDDAQGEDPDLANAGEPE